MPVEVDQCMLCIARHVLFETRLAGLTQMLLEAALHLQHVKDELCLLTVFLQTVQEDHA